MAELLKGAPVAAALDEKTREAVHLLKIRGVRPTLGILRVGERPDDTAYESAAVRRCEKLGIEVRRVSLPEDVKQGALLAQIARLNSDDNVHGVLMFRPLPVQLDEEEACAALLRPEIRSRCFSQRRVSRRRLDARYPNVTLACSDSWGNSSSVSSIV